MEAQNNIELVLTVISAFGALVAAIAAWKAAVATRRVAEAQLGARFLESYQSTEMLEALHTLISVPKEHGPDFAQKWVRVKEVEPWAKKVDLARRYVVSYFLNLARLRREKLVTNRVVRAAGLMAGIRVLYEVAEPLEAALNLNYAKESFNLLKRIIPPEEAQRLSNPPDLQQNAHC
jgi:hypothetical protein